MTSNGRINSIQESLCGTIVPGNPGTDTVISGIPGTISDGNPFGVERHLEIRMPDNRDDGKWIGCPDIDNESPVPLSSRKNISPRRVADRRKKEKSARKARRRCRKRSKS